MVKPLSYGGRVERPEECATGIRASDDIAEVGLPNEGILGAELQ